MARYQITVSGKGLRKASVKKLIDRFKSELNGASVSVVDATPPESRADRFSAAMSQVEEAQSEIDSLKDELQNWFDNLPENFQQGDKGSELEEAISELETLSSNLEDAARTNVSFPGMY